MANLLPFLLMTETQAANFRDVTSGDADRLDPRKVDLGIQAGRYVLPARVLYDPAFAARQDAFRMLQQVNLDTDAVFAAPIEDE